MSLSWNVDFSAKKLKHLRAIFANCFHNISPFALEFTSNDRRVLVVMFTSKNGEIFMTTELHDRFSGLIRKTGEHLVTLDRYDHDISLKVEISPTRFGYAQFFYKWDVLMSFPYEMGCFWLDRYSRVLFWSDSRKRSFSDPPGFEPTKRAKYVC